MIDKGDPVAPSGPVPFPCVPRIGLQKRTNATILWLPLTKEMFFSISSISWLDTVTQSLQPSNRTGYSQLPLNPVRGRFDKKLSLTGSRSSQDLKSSRPFVPTHIDELYMQESPVQFKYILT